MLRRHLPIYQIDAFTRRVFGGNPAAVCPLEEWLPDKLLQQIAAENNLSETAFFVSEPDNKYRLRWFTPTVEVDMCGHATLASAALVLERLQPEWPSVTFLTRSGPLSVCRRIEESGAAGRSSELTMDFPLWPASEAPAPAPSSLVAALGGAPVEAFPIPPMHGGAPYWLFLFKEQAEVAALTPDFGAMEANVLATAVAARTATDSSGGEDFVSRF